MTKRAPKTPYHHGDLRNALMREALRQIRKVGVGKLTLKSIAKGVGVSHTAPYRHFDNKQALLFEVAKDGFDRLSRAFQKAFEAAPHGSRQQFLDAGYSIVHFAMTHPDHYQLMFFGEVANDLRELAQSEPDSAFGLLLGFIDCWQTSGLMRPGPRLDIAMSLWTSTHGLACLISSGQLRLSSRDELRALADQVHGNLLDGLGPA